MKSKIALICIIAIIVSCISPLFVPVYAATSWSGWTASSGAASVKNGILYIGKDTTYETTVSLPENYVVKTTFRVTKFPESGHCGVQVRNGKNRTGIYMAPGFVHPFENTGRDITVAVGNEWHDWTFYVEGDTHQVYMDGNLVLTGKNNTCVYSPSATFFIVGDGNIEVESFDIQYDASQIEGAELETILTAPVETEYAPEFTIDWTKPETYKDWTMTDTEHLYVDEKGNLVFDISLGKEWRAKPIYLQAERAAKTPANFDFEFDLQMESNDGDAFLFKAVPPGYNTFQYVAPYTIRTSGVDGTDAIRADIGNEWHHWKLEIRGKYTTFFMDGNEVKTLEMTKTSSNSSLLRFLLSDCQGNYKINVGKVHYKPYFPEVDMEAPSDHAEYLEGADVVFKAVPSTSVDYVDYYVNGIKVGKGQAPDYTYTLKDMKVGTYRVSAGVGDSVCLERTIKVKGLYNVSVNTLTPEISCGETAKVSVDVDYFNETVKPVLIEYIVDGKSVGKSTATPDFACEIKDLPVGTANVQAKIVNNNGAQTLSDPAMINVLGGANSAQLKREYIVEYNYSGGNGSIDIRDGYFNLKLNHSDNKVTYSTVDGTEEYLFGAGEYKVVATAGNAEVYRNGKLAFTLNMPQLTGAQGVTCSGVENFVINGSGVKTTVFSERRNDWTDFKKVGYDFPEIYSLEFDKTDVSDETIAVYDGKFKINLEFKNGKINTENYRTELGKAVPYTLAKDATPGYYRLTVANGLAQLFVNNKYIDSFYAPMSVRPSGVYRDMSNPVASTIVEVKKANDVYFHSDDFSGNTEFASVDYWIEDVATIKVDQGDSCMTIKGTGDALLSGTTRDTMLKWSAKIDSGTKKFRVTTRAFQGWHYLYAGYDFEKNTWYLDKIAKRYSWKMDTHDEFQGGVIPTTDVWHDFELYLKDDVLILTMDGETVVSVDDLGFGASGHVGFGVVDGGVSIDNFGYEGRGIPTASIKSAVYDDVHYLFEFFEKEDGRVICENPWGGISWKYTDDKGETWSDWQMAEPGQFTNSIIRLQSGKLFRLAANSAGGLDAQVSNDDGETWTVTGNTKSARDAVCQIILNGSTMQTSTGRIFIAADEHQVVEYTSSTGIYYSDDEGYTWHEAETVMGGFETGKDKITTEHTGYNVQEGGLVELPDGTIRYTGRTGNGFVYYMDSHDGGKNFGELRPMQLIGSLCTFAVEQDDNDPNTYFAITEYEASSYDFHKYHNPRQRFALMVSWDGMESWEFVTTLNETTDYNILDACNHSLRVFDDTVYVAWGAWEAPHSVVYAIDKNKIRSLKRFEAIHERIQRGSMGDYVTANQVLLPKSSDVASIYGEYVDVMVKDGRYDAVTVANIFGATPIRNGSAVSLVIGAESSVYDKDIVFTLGDIKVKFTEGASTYEVNGETKNFDGICMKEGYLDIKACAEAFGKMYTEIEEGYVIWNDEPGQDEYLDEMLSFWR